MCKKKSGFSNAKWNVRNSSKKWMFFVDIYNSSERYCGIRRHFVYCILSLDQEIYVSLCDEVFWCVPSCVVYQSTRIINCKMLITLYEFELNPHSNRDNSQTLFFLFLFYVCECIFFSSFRCVLFSSMLSIPRYRSNADSTVWLCFKTGPTNL